MWRAGLNRMLPHDQEDQSLCDDLVTVMKADEELISHLVATRKPQDRVELQRILRHLPMVREQAVKRASEKSALRPKTAIGCEPAYLKVGSLDKRLGPAPLTPLANSKDWHHTASFEGEVVNTRPRTQGPSIDHHDPSFCNAPFELEPSVAPRLTSLTTPRLKTPRLTTPRSTTPRSIGRQPTPRSHHIGSNDHEEPLQCFGDDFASTLKQHAPSDGRLALLPGDNEARQKGSQRRGGIQEASGSCATAPFATLDRPETPNSRPPVSRRRSDLIEDKRVETSPRAQATKKLVAPEFPGMPGSVISRKVLERKEREEKATREATERVVAHLAELGIDSKVLSTQEILQMLYSRGSGSSYWLMNRDAASRHQVRCPTPRSIRQVLTEGAARQVTEARDLPATKMNQYLDHWEIEFLADSCRSIKTFNMQRAGIQSEYKQAYCHQARAELARRQGHALFDG